MRRRILFFLLAAATIPATAAKRETVAQLEQTLTAAYASHKQDAEIARQISGMELSERLTRDTLRRFSSPMAPNSQAVLALEVLADQSEFLDPPSDELPPLPLPMHLLSSACSNPHRGTEHRCCRASELFGHPNH